MQKITEIQDSIGNIHIYTEHEDGSFTSMPKLVYDEQQAKEAALLEKPTAKK